MYILCLATPIEASAPVAPTKEILVQHLLRLRTAVASLAILAVIAALALAVGPTGRASAATLTTAWQNGTFSENVAGVIGRSDVVIGQANSAATQYLPLGNGNLGVAEWAAGGFTAQLNRSDTMPDRKSPGWVKIPGLAPMTSASNFKATLDVYNGVLNESGGGMTAKIWVAANKDELIVDVTGANPANTQTATVNLWTGRNPTAAVSGSTATLAETWVDNSGSGTTGATFGSLAAITAGGQGVTASVVNSTTIQTSFKPNTDGTFRVVVGAPTWTGGNAATTASSLIGSDPTAAESSLLATESSHWNSFWAANGNMEITSPDGSGEYMENLRALYLYDEEASMGGKYGGSQAGVADMFNYDQDHQDWYPAGFWLWNLRAEIATNMSTGNFAANIPIFNMYLNDIPAIQSWTNAQMGGKPGICVPETMRFNGNGYYNDSASNASCSIAASPSYNALDITSGAEIALWIWQQYQDTGNTSFLQTYYPLMQQASTFLLAFQTVGSDGFLHANANAHETQWAVTDPTTDLAADAALFPATVAAATKLNTDASLVSQLRTAENQIEPYSRTDAATHQQLLTPSADAGGTDVISDSFQPTATIRNGENIGLEPVWPYGLIGANSSLTALADRTYNSRPNVYGNDWSMDAVDAARLGMASQVQTDLVQITERNQGFIAGTASLGGTTPGTEPYLEQSATVGTALDEALATDYDGTLRFAPAWPSAWNVAGTVYIQGGSKVDVQVQGGTVTTAALIAGSTASYTVKNPFASTEVVNGSSGAVVVSPTTAATFTIAATAGTSYLIENTAQLTTSYTFAQVTGSVATTDKHLGPVQIGLDASVSSGSGPTFYADANFGGASATLGVGSYDLPQLQAAGIANDSISSIRVPSGFTVVAYGDTGFAGTSWTFTADNANLANSGGNDAISSLKVSSSGGSVISLRAHANGDIVTADNTGTSPLIANRTSVGQWESFDLINNADGSVSLRAHANGDIVTADNAGASPLIANRTSIGPWEEFDLINNADGSVSLRAHANGDIVTADNAGASPLIANRTAVGSWEEFDLIHD
jgi:hypothetical protein